MEQSRPLGREDGIQWGMWHGILGELHKSGAITSAAFVRLRDEARKIRVQAWKGEEQ